MVAMIKERMLGYYPEIIKQIYEIQTIVEAEYPEIELSINGIESVLNDAYLTTMGESRIKQWESFLGIGASQTATLEERRTEIIGRIRGYRKVNTDYIYELAKLLTGGFVESISFYNGVLSMEIVPLEDDESVQWEGFEKALKRSLPAHIGIDVQRSFGSWQDIKDNFNTWNDVKNEFDQWNDVYLYRTFYA